MARSQRVQLVLSAYSLAVFAVLWAGAIAAVTGAWLPADTWTAYTGLAPAVQVVLLVVVTPIVVALWAGSAALPGVALVAVACGLGLWTLASVASLRSALTGLRRR